MAATFTVNIKSKSRDGNLAVVEADVTWAGTYSTGGDTLAPGKLGLRHIDDASVVAKVGSAAHGYQVVLAGTRSAPKLKLYFGANTELADATATAQTIRMRFKGDI